MRAISRPRDVWLRSSQVRGKILRGLANLDQTYPVSIEDRLVLDTPAPAVALNRSDRVEYVPQTIGSVARAHSVAASARTSSHTCGRELSGVPTSTFTPRMSSASQAKPIRSSKLASASRLTSRSTSLDWLFSPRATEPNTRTSRARLRSAAARRADRLATSSRPKAVVGTNCFTPHRLTRGRAHSD